MGRQAFPGHFQPFHELCNSIQWFEVSKGRNAYWLRWWNKVLSRVLGRREEGRGEERHSLVKIRTDPHRHS
jgi:hypothetical protein